jgi:DNA end-binding protein Ku
MASSRSTWRGSIRFSLVTIPIRVFPATTTSDVAFRQLHSVCHTPIQLKKWCPQCEQEVSADELVKGYESAKGQFVVVEEEEIRKVRPESTHTVAVSYMLDVSEIDPLYVERVYFLAPDNKEAGSAYAVLRDGLGDRAGIGHLALRGREYLVAVVPKGDHLEMYTLRTAGEVREASSIDELSFAAGKVKPDEIKLAKMVLEHLPEAPRLSTFTDRYQETLREMLAAKAPEARAVESAGRGGKRDRVVNLMDALRESLNQVKTTRPPATARRAAGKPRPARARILAHPTQKRKRAS